MPRRDDSSLTKEVTVSDATNVVLVHGGFVDGSGWEGVYRLLKQDGFKISVVQNPTLSLEDDVAVTRRVLDKQDGPTILVGHSYGGAVITEAGNHDKVAGLAYFAADVAPDLAAFMADAQVPWGVGAPNGNISEAAWRSKPSWYLIATDDHMIPPPAQRTMAERIGATVTETPGSHAVYVSNPAAVASLITQAARSAVRETTSVG